MRSGLKLLASCARSASNGRMSRQLSSASATRTTPSGPPSVSRAAALAAESVRRRKIRNGSSGAGERASMPMNAAINPAEVASSPRVRPSLQPCSLVRVMA
jgi:hypothetical protein